MVVCLIHCALRNHYKTCCESKVLVLIGLNFLGLVPCSQEIMNPLNYE